MTTMFFFLVLIALGAILVRYARNDRFAGPRNHTPRVDGFGAAHDSLLRRLG
jgi:hypothetical protein